MNMSELTDAVHGEIGEAAKLSKKQVAETVASTIAVITAALSKGEKVGLTGFGTFDVRETPAKKGKNPSTGQVIDIPAGKRASFKVGKGLKDAIKA